MGYAICVFIGLILGIVITAICARGKMSDYEMEIYRLKKEIRKLENSVGEVYGGE